MDNEKGMAELFNLLVKTINDADLDQSQIGAVLVKLTVLQGISRQTHDEFFQQLEYAWKFEEFFMPDSDEIH